MNLIALLFGVVLIVVLPLTAHAIPAITCHCFTDRSFDQSRPAVADPYFLATTQNSFFAVVFNADKKTIVMKKQQGTSADDLWVAYWVASRSGGSAEALLRARTGSEQWRYIVASLRVPAKTFGIGFSAALSAGKPVSELAGAVVDELYRHYQLLSDKDLAALRRAGASNQELIIATTIAAKTSKTARQVYLDVKGGITTWGSLLRSTGIDTRNMQHEVATLLKLKPL